jgi:hypothetical protein
LKIKEVDSKLKLTLLLTASLLIAGCGGRRQSVDSEEHGASEEETLTQDTLPAFQSALGYFEASKDAFLDGQYRYAADFILAGIEEVKATRGSLPGKDEEALDPALQQLDRMAARLSRYELEGPEQEIQRDYARAALEMVYILLIIEKVDEDYPVTRLIRLLEFCLDALRQAHPFLRGDANTAAAPLLESGRITLTGLSARTSPATRAETVALLQSIQAFLRRYKTEIEIPESPG